MEVINQIIADASGTDAQKAKFILSQRIIYGLDLAEWRSLLVQLPASLRQEIGQQTATGNAPTAFLMLAMRAMLQAVMFASVVCS